MMKNPRHIRIPILLLILIAGGLCTYYFRQTLLPTQAYVAGKGSEIEVYLLDDDGKLNDAGALIRGSEVYLLKKTVNGTEDTENEGKTFSGIRTKEGDEFYISQDNIADNPEDCVRETEIYVRTPATVYSDAEGPGIASFVPKGTKLAIAGYDRLLDSGAINKYKIEFINSKDKKVSGYIYGKYATADEAAAKAFYNANGEFDKAKKNVYGMELYGGKAASLDFYPYERTAIEGNKFCDNARAMYLNASAAVNYKPYIKLIGDTDCNAVVIDLKDGPLAYKSETAREISPASYKNAYTSLEKFKEAVDAYREAGLYLIGRIVVFNDPYYAKDHPEDCIKYNGSSSWPSAYSRAVWEYNVRLAQEAVREFGLNEIQFDYVRFPESSYEMSKSGKAKFRNSFDEEKGQAVQNFCFYAADQLREVGAYISVDVFGESAYGYMTAYGQYWAGISNIVDAISAMPYTDHFGGNEPWADPYDSVRRWAKRAEKQQKMLSDPAAARTWITGYDTPYWNPVVAYGDKELDAQVRALEKSGLDGGFIPWNAASDIDKYRKYKGIWKEKK